MFTPGAQPVHKATITARGNSLGMTVMLPAEDGHLLKSRKQLLADLDVAMGGRIAEEMVPPLPLTLLRLIFPCASRVLVCAVCVCVCAC